MRERVRLLGPGESAFGLPETRVVVENVVTAERLVRELDGLQLAESERIVAVIEESDDESLPSLQFTEIYEVGDSPGFADRYSVGLRDYFWEDGLEDSGEYVYWHLSISGDPTHPQGVSLSGDGVIYLPDEERIGWDDLPAHIRRHVLLRNRESEPDFPYFYVEEVVYE